jgi:nitrite reductase/ring-hydroxylating ferredoxin subunit/uncharacterized membrane protein
MLSLVVDLVSFGQADPNDLFRVSRYALGLGLAMGTLAALTGLMDRSDIRLDHPARKTSTIHMALNFTALGLFGINFLLRLGQGDAVVVPPLSLLLSLVGVGIILFSGYLGGTMVYDDGIAVGRHRRYTRTPRQTIDVSILKRQDGWAPVCEEGDLKDGETLRVDYDGYIIAVARQAGKVYAFQEFCTHRYGPLSEGKLEGHNVICPWHRSCFDIRTGKVVEGPAKVDLKTYSTLVRGGKIFIK